MTGNSTRTKMSVPSMTKEMPLVALREIQPSSSTPAAPSVPSGRATRTVPSESAPRTMPPGPAAKPTPLQTSSEKKRKDCTPAEHPSGTKRFKVDLEEDLHALPIHRTASSSECVQRVMPSHRGLPRSMTYPRAVPRLHSRPKYPGPYLKNYTRLSMRNKISPGTFKLKRRTSTDPRPSEVSFRVSSGTGEEFSFPVSTHNAKEVNVGECIVDFLCCSQDVTLYKVFLSFDGKLEIQDQSFKSLRTATSDTGQFVFEEPLVLEARKSYRIYFDSRFESVAPYQGTTWDIQFGDVTLEWGHCAIVGGMQLLVSS